MKHYTMDEKSAYFMKHIFSACVGSVVQISNYTFRKHIRVFGNIITHLVDNGYIAIVEKGGYKKTATKYRILKKWDVDVDIKELENVIKNKRNKKNDSLCRSNNLFVDVSDSEIIKTSPQQLTLINSINTKDIIVKQSANKTIWTAFSSLKKEYRQLVKQIDTNESLVELDINASIPRLLPTYFTNYCKNWADDYKKQINEDIEKYKTAIKKYPDAYQGLIEILELDISREMFKDYFLKMLFGAGTKDGAHKLEIKDAFTRIFPGMSVQLKRYADLNRVKKSSCKSWKQSLFAGQIFNIQARIIEQTLKNLDCDKYSVFDSINVPAAYVEKARTSLIEAWNNVTSESGMLGFKIAGIFYNAVPSVQSVASVTSVPSTPDCQDYNLSPLRIESGLDIERGRGLYHMNATFELKGLKRFLKDSKSPLKVTINEAEEGDEALAIVIPNEAVSVANNLKGLKSRCREAEIKQYRKRYRVKYKGNWIPSNNKETYDQFKKRIEETYPDIKIKEII